MKKIINQNKLYRLKQSSKISLLRKKIIFFVLIRNYGLLSFGNEAEEDEEEITKISMVSIDFILFHFLNSMFIEIQTKRNWKKCT
jgi:hypothetical protein